MTPDNLHDALALVEALQRELRSALEDARRWRRFQVIERWSANVEDRKRMGTLLLNWEENYDEEIERKCSGEDEVL